MFWLFSGQKACEADASLCETPSSAPCARCTLLPMLKVRSVQCRVFCQFVHNMHVRVRVLALHVHARATSPVAACMCPHTVCFSHGRPPSHVSLSLTQLGA